MAKIKISGINEMMDVQNDKARQIQRIVGDHSINANSMIEVGTMTVKKSSIVAIKLDDESVAQEKRLCERLDEPEVRVSIKNFELEIENHALASTTHPAEWYGKPVTIKEKVWAINPVIGGLPLRIIQYAVDNRIIVRNEKNGNINWAIAATPEGGIAHYNEFSEKLAALRELWNRRSYIDKNKKEEVDQAIEAFEKQTSVMPERAETIVETLPF